jgi:hypothetical protein
MTRVFALMENMPFPKVSSRGSGIIESPAPCGSIPGISLPSPLPYSAVQNRNDAAVSKEAQLNFNMQPYVIVVILQVTPKINLTDFPSESNRIIVTEFPTPARTSAGRLVL